MNTKQIFSTGVLAVMALSPLIYGIDSAKANCDVGINFSQKYTIDETPQIGVTVGNIEKMKARFSEILKAKGYGFNSGNSVHYSFSVESNVHKRSASDVHFAIAKLEVRHKGIEALINSPQTVPYLPDSGSWINLDALTRTEWRAGNNEQSDSINLLSDVESLAAQIPECSTLQAAVEPSFEKMYSSLYQQVQFNQNPDNKIFDGYIPEIKNNDGSIPKNLADRYCLIKVTEPKCEYYQPGSDLSSAYDCSATFEFRVKGDPRIFQKTESRLGLGYDRINGNLVSVVLNVPLLFTPAMVGKVVTKAIAYQEASTKIENLVQSFSKCQE